MHGTHEYPAKAVDARAIRHGPMVVRVLCGVVLIGWGTLGLVMAGEELGQFCWRLEPYVDTVRLSVSVSTGDVQMFHVLASWRAGPAPANQTTGGQLNDTRTTKYEFLGTGTARASITPRDPPGAINIGIVAGKIFGFSSDFSGQEICTLRMTITVPSLNGSFWVACPFATLPATLTQSAVFHPCSGNE